MADWPLFSGLAVVLALGFVLLAAASARVLRAALEAPGEAPTPTPAPGAVAPDGRDAPDASRPRFRPDAADARERPAERAVPPVDLGPDWWRVGNVVASHGLLLVALLATAWYARVPPDALGLRPPVPGAVGLGALLGVALAAVSGASARLARRLGLEVDERLRTLLTPETTLGWAGLLLVGLPLVAAAEELLFRGALVGGLAAGLGWPVWGLVAASSVLFGLGHGLQGPGGVVVTAGLGAALGAAFVLTGSLAVVVVAHYVVNALEFVAGGWGDGGQPAGEPPTTPDAP